MNRHLRTAAVIALAGTLLVPAVPVAGGVLPVAVADDEDVIHDRTLTVAAPGVLANDLQLGGDFTARLVRDANHGDLDLDANGGFEYRPDDGYAGTDSFRYRIDGGLLGLSNTATVTIEITNERPDVAPDSYTAVADVQKSISAPGVLANDDDGDGDALTIDVVNEPTHGTLNEDDDGSFRYLADDGFSGNDVWRYRAWDGVAWSPTVAVTMVVSAPAATPQPTPDPTPPPTPRPTPRPSIIPTLPPLPSVPTLPSLDPAAPPRPSSTPSTAPTSTPTSRPSATASPDPSADPSRSGDPGGPAGGVSSGRQGPGSAPRPSGDTDGSAGLTITLPSIDDRSQLAFDPGSISFGSFEWAVPALVLTVPGLLIVIAVLVQTVVGLAWLPIARRWLGGDRRRRPAALRAAVR